MPLSGNTTYLLSNQIWNMGQMPSFQAYQLWQRKKLTGQYKRAIPAVACLQPWSQVNSLQLAKRFSLWPIIKRLKLKLFLFTFLCTHYLSSTLLSSQYNIRSHLNSTHSMTRGQTYLCLTLPKVNRRPGSVSPLFVGLFTLEFSSLSPPNTFYVISAV